MLKTIKTTYFLSVLFSHILEEQKLKLARHCKYLQKIIDRRLIHYKSFSERYIVFGQNGKGKEYNGITGKLIFEGEYVNGKRNGKGKEYYNGKLRFEGEYINGKRNGKGKLYDSSNGNLLFEGHYLNGEKNGEGKEFASYPENKLIFEGEFLNGKRNGKGKEYKFNSDELVFEGE